MEITKELLEKWYLTDKKSLAQIARMVGCGYATVQRLFVGYCIPRRAFSTKGLQPCLGRVLSDETKKKIGDAHRGISLSPEHREKVIKTLRPGVGRGQDHPGWKGGIIRRAGYVYIWMKDHPRVLANGYVKRAVLVAEKKLGRYLVDGEITHHINCVKDDDRPENIAIISASEHRSIHNAIASETKRLLRQKEV